MYIFFSPLSLPLFHIHSLSLTHCSYLYLSPFCSFHLSHSLILWLFSLSLSISLSFSLSLFLSLSLFVSLSQSLYLSLSLSIYLSLSQPLYLSLSLNLSLSLYLSLSLSLPQCPYFSISLSLTHHLSLSSFPSFLQPHNILLSLSSSGKWIAKISDFGTSVHINSELILQHDPGSPLPSTAPSPQKIEIGEGARGLGGTLF